MCGVVVSTTVSGSSQKNSSHTITITWCITSSLVLYRSENHHGSLDAKNISLCLIIIFHCELYCKDSEKIEH